MKATGLYWLPESSDWRGSVGRLSINIPHLWSEISRLANAPLTLARTNALDEHVQRLGLDSGAAGLEKESLRIAILGSSTTTHLHASIRVAGYRRGLWITTYECAYVQYLQELMDPTSPLHRFKPNVVLFSFDAHHVTEMLSAENSNDEANLRVDELLRKIQRCWVLARDAFDCYILQQTVMNALPGVLGQNEHRLAGSRRSAIAKVNSALRDMADAEGVDLVSIDERIERDGISYWYSSGQWHRTKQEVLPTAAPLYGELVLRLLAARLGISKKCLVLDLDNTLWGGVIGDDGLEGIVIGHGSGEGESFLAIQDHVRELARRGVILAICSKNDEENAWEPFDKHPDMLLRRADIACMQANWNDKATNLRIIAERLSIGLDAIVYLDDNPFERALVRQELPMVAVPEFPDDPAFVPQLLADSGYFEGVIVTNEDRLRSKQYQIRAASSVSMMAPGVDLNAYLQSLEMELVWSRFGNANLQRVVQLINKTNQFNLTTRRYNEPEIKSLMSANRAFGLQFRLRDKFGDHGITTIIIGRMEGHDSVLIDTWLMSCRVLGRQVERATLNVVAEEGRRLGATKLIGEYIPTKKNAMVEGHYKSLGFEESGCKPGGGNISVLDITKFSPLETAMKIIKEE